MTFYNGWQWQQIIPNKREPKGTLTLLQKKTDIQRMVCSWVGLGHPQSCKSATRPTWSPHIFHFQPPHVSFSDWWGLGPPLSPKSYTMFFCGVQIGDAAHLQLDGSPNPTQLTGHTKFEVDFKRVPLGAANRFSGGCKSATRPICSKYILI